MTTRGLNQRGLAKMLGRSEAFVSLVLKGTRHPSEEEAHRWAAALGLAEAERKVFLERALLELTPGWIAERYRRRRTTRHDSSGDRTPGVPPT
jgi:transcriptional regulator with XRE-family HTH domain